jgi:hypothetical protein
MSKPEIYISIDVEADGPIPGLFSMLQFGAAAFLLEGEEPRKPVGTFETNLDLLPGASQSPDTMAWWTTQGDAYANTRKATVDPRVGMARFVEWCKALPGRPVIVGYPVTYDFMWVYWYTMAFGGLGPDEHCPFGFQGLDIKTLAAERLGLPFRDASKRRMPKRWFDGAPKHTHDGLDDAIGQGVLFVNIKGEDPKA